MRISDNCFGQYFEKPTSEDDLREPGSSHLHWLHLSFMMRSRVTNSKPLLIFSVVPVQKYSVIILFKFFLHTHTRCVILT